MSILPFPLVALLVFPLSGSLAQEKNERVDAYGDPLPEAAIKRLGTIRFRDVQGSSIAALSPDGKLIAVGSNGSRPVRLLDALTGKEVRTMKGQMYGSSFLAFSPDGKVLASSYYGNQINLWNAVTGDALPNIGDARNRMSAFVFSGDAKRIASGSDGHQAQNPIGVWDVATGKQAMTGEPIHNVNIRVALSPDGKILASWGNYYDRTGKGQRDEESQRGRTVQLWDIEKGKELKQIKHDVNMYVGNTVFAPDGKTLVTVGQGTGLTVWDIAEGKEVRRFSGRRGLGAMVCFSPDGKQLAASTHSGAIQVWEYATGKRLGNHELGGGQQTTRISYTTDGKLLGLQSNGQALTLWDVRAEKALTPRSGHETTVNAVAFDAKGQRLTSVSTDGFIREWDLASGKETARRVTRDEESMRYGRGRPSQAAVVSPDRKYLLTGDYNGLVLWDLATGRETCTLPIAYSPYGLSAAFSADGSRVAASGRNPRVPGVSVRVFDVNTGQEIREIDTAGEETRLVGLSPDGKAVVAITQDTRGTGQQEVRLWDVADGKRRWHLTRTGNGVMAMAFSPDGQTMALGDTGGTIALLTAGKGEELRRLTPGTAMQIYRLCFSPDGRTLAAAGMKPDGRSACVIVWELATGSVRQELSGHASTIMTMDFTPDGALLATGSADTTVLLWDLTGRVDVQAKARPTAKEIDDCWSGLDSLEGKLGHRAMARLLAAPLDAVALFKQKLEPAKGESLDAQKIAELVVDLDHRRFNKRDEAFRQLETLGKAAEAELKKALIDKPSLEKKKKVEELLGKLEGQATKPQLVRPLRAIEVLERLGTTEAREFLEQLAGGTAEARQTREAKRALERIVRMSKPTS